MTHRRAAIRSLRVGDIFHADCPDGPSLICLITVVTKARILARTVTQQISLDFDRETGVAYLGDSDIACPIDSVAPVQDEIREGLLSMDRKFRTVTDPEKLKLLDIEKRARLFVHAHYRDHPI